MRRLPSVASLAPPPQKGRALALTLTLALSLTLALTLTPTLTPTLTLTLTLTLTRCVASLKGLGLCATLIAPEDGVVLVRYLVITPSPRTGWSWRAPRTGTLTLNQHPKPTPKPEPKPEPKPDPNPEQESTKDWSCGQLQDHEGDLTPTLTPTLTLTLTSHLSP